MLMIDPQTPRNPVEQLAEAFLERYRRGERPSLSEYTQAHPELADEIRDLFPALVMMEEAGPRDADRLGPCGGRVTADGQELRHLGDYRILRQVARGGMGVVYEAEQEALGRHVALKVLPFESAADPTRLERFRREARAAARLHHTNIVPVFDVGAQEGVHYYAMQFIQGQSLDEVLAEVKRLRAGKEAGAAGPALRLAGELASGLLTGQFMAEELQEASRGPEAPEEAGNPDQPSPEADASGLRAAADSASSTSDVLKSQSDFSTQSDFHYYRSVARVGLQVAEALAYAHGQKVLHRDIKPSNLLLDLQGIIWVTDFGLAKDESEDLTRTGDVVGTLRYMAPERFKGISDPRSDIYSLGLTLYELLTLRPAFQESDRARLIWRVSHEDPPAPRKADRRLPRDLETIVLKAIAREPGRRYQTAEEMAEDLRRFLADRPIRARRSSWAEQAWRWCRRNPGWAAMFVAMTVLLLVIAVGALVSAASFRGALAESRSHLWEAYLAEARGRRMSHRNGQRLRSLEAIRKALELPVPPKHSLQELRTEAIAALALYDLELADEWAGFEDLTNNLDFDGNFETYALVDKDGNATVHRRKDRQQVARLPGFGLKGYSRPLLSSDGRHLVVYGHGGRCKVWQLQPLQSEPRWEFAEGTIAFATFSLDSRHLALVTADGAVDFSELAAGRRWHLRDPAARISYVAFHPGGRQVAVVAQTSQRSVVQVRDLDSGSVTATLSPTVPTIACTWHPRGQVLALRGSDHRIRIWDVPERKEMVVLPGHENGTDQFAFNHAGDLSVSLCRGDKTLRCWDPFTGQMVFQTRYFCSLLRFSLDDRLLAPDVVAEGNLLRLHEVAVCHEYRTLSRKGSITSPVVSPDGRFLAAASGDGVRFWDLETGQELALLKAVQGPTGLLFETGGKALLTHSPQGLWRWPIRNQEGGRRLVGPPEAILLHTTGGAIACSQNGSVLALCPGLILHPETHSLPIHIRQSNVGSCSVSPDGRFVAFGSYSGPGEPDFIVYEAATGKRIFAGPVGFEACDVAFSPDGRWLATTSGGTRLWAVDSWRQTHIIGGKRPAFDPRGKTLAVEKGDGAIRLVDLAEGRELAVLADPQQSMCDAVCFSPDGTRLIAASTTGSSLHAWDLRLLRQRLKLMCLDWDQHEFSPSADPAPGVRPQRIEIVGPELDDPGKLREFARSCSILALWLNPFDGEANVRLGVILLQEGQHAAAFTRLSLGLLAHPDHLYARYHRARAAYRLQRWSVAADDLTKLLLSGPAGPEVVWLRAQAWQHLDRHAEALADWNSLASVYPRSFELHQARADSYEALGQKAEAAVARQEAQSRMNAGSLNDLAWRLVTGPAGDRDPDRALRIMQVAIKIQPDSHPFLNTWGVVQYRVGRYREAVAALEKSLAAGGGKDAAYDDYFLAMCHYHLNDPLKARACFDRAVTWRSTQPEPNAVLDALHAEAAALLGLPDPSKPQATGERSPER